jgi:hypothetical protein
MKRIAMIPLACLCALMACATSAPVELMLYVHPERGDDSGKGTRQNPFQTVHRAQEAVREAVPGMQGDIVVNLAPGEYRLTRSLKLTESDSGRNGFKVIYRSQEGPGQARLLASFPLREWEEYRDGIWKHDLDGYQALRSGAFTTLYEDGKRARVARFPNYVHRPEQPTAMGPYLLTEDGSPRPEEGERTAWLKYFPDDAPPITEVTSMQVHIFEGGYRDWFRRMREVIFIDPDQRRIEYKGNYVHGTLARARYFLANELAFLDEPGEFYLDRSDGVLYYMPFGEGHPDTLNINAPLLGRLIEMQGASREEPVENIVLDGLALEETDDYPAQDNWWGTDSGREDGALIWMTYAQNIQILRCHLRNSGRHGIMIVGHNIGNLVEGSLIEHMGVNGVTFANHFEGTENRNEHNRIYNCRIGHVGESRCYAENIGVRNASYNEVSYTELHDSVRYAITLRGNTTPHLSSPEDPIGWIDFPPTKGNHFHHLRIERVGQDSGDMGALHGANLNIPDGDAVNIFEQITVADTVPAPGLTDIPPDGIFLDWPKMAMHQVFRNIHIVRTEGAHLRSNRRENADSSVKDNVSWVAGFQREGMAYDQIGVTGDFPAVYGGLPRTRRAADPGNVEARALAHDAVKLAWDPIAASGEDPVVYVVLRDGVAVGETTALSFTDRHFLTEDTGYIYQVAARKGDFVQDGDPSPALEVRTPRDQEPPALKEAYLFPGDPQRIRLVFSEAIVLETAEDKRNYHIEPALSVLSAERITPDCVELVVDGLQEEVSYKVSSTGIRDTSAAGNPVDPQSVAIQEGQVLAHYSLSRLYEDRLWDESGGGDATLRGGVTVERHAGPDGGPALFFDGTGYVKGPTDIDLGDGDFTIMFWYYRHSQSGVILSKGGEDEASAWSISEPRGYWGGLSFGLDGRNSLQTSRNSSGTKGRWVHWVFSRSGDMLMARADGVLQGSGSVTGLDSLVNQGPLLIGRQQDDETGPWFRGWLADIKILRHAVEWDPISYRFTHPAGSVNNAGYWEPYGLPGPGDRASAYGDRELVWRGPGSQNHLAGAALVLNDSVAAVNDREFHLEVSGPWTFNDTASLRANSIRLLPGAEFHWHSAGAWSPVSETPEHRRQPMFSMQLDDQQEFRASMSDGLWDLTGHAGSTAFDMRAGTFEMSGGTIFADALWRLGTGSGDTGALFVLGGDGILRLESLALLGDATLNFQGTKATLFIDKDSGDWKAFIRGRAANGQIQVDGVAQPRDTAMLVFDTQEVDGKEYLRVQVAR